MSSNDAIPTAIHIAAMLEINDNLLPALNYLQKELSKEIRAIYVRDKNWTKHLQDATPIKLGQEFLGYAGQIERGIERLKTARVCLSSVALGGTAVGTGI